MILGMVYDCLTLLKPHPIISIPSCGIIPYYMIGLLMIGQSSITTGWGPQSSFAFSCRTEKCLNSMVYGIYVDNNYIGFYWLINQLITGRTHPVDDFPI